MLLIFDCDGVLVDSEMIATAVDVEALAALGYRIETRTFIDRFVGKSSRDMLAAIESEMGRPLPADFAESRATELQRRFRAELKAMPGVAEAIGSLPGPRCVASSSSPQRIRLSLQLTGLLHLFDPHIFSATQGERGKPAPDLFLLAAERMKADRRTCLVIEDSVAGATGARAAGMTVLGFHGGSHADERLPARLRAAGAHEIFAHMRDLPDLVARMWSGNAVP